MNDGRQQQSKSTSEEDRELRKQAIRELRKWLDGRTSNGNVSILDKRRGGKGLQNGLVENTIEAKPEENEQGDNDGRQQQQSTSEKDRERNRELKRQAINRIREWMDGGRHNGFISRAY